MQYFQRQPGFTLLEVLVAIAVFSVVAMVSYTTLDTYLDQRDRLTQHYGKLERLQRLFILLERDIQYTIKRTVRDGGDLLPAIMSANGDGFISMTVALPDIENPTGIALRRVQWRLEGEEMFRAEWEVLDRSNAIEPSELLISDEVDDVEINYLSYDLRSGVSSDSSLEPEQIPDGVEVTIALNTGETYRRVFAVAGGGLGNR